MAPKKDQKMIGEAPAHKKARIGSPSGTSSSTIESHIKDGDVEPDSGNVAVTLETLKSWVPSASVSHSDCPLFQIVGSQLRMSPEYVAVALDGTVVVNKLWSDLIATEALGADFLNCSALSISTTEHGWVSPWKVSESKIASDEMAQTYQGSVHAKLIKHGDVGTKVIEWPKCQHAYRQWFGHTVPRRDRDFPIVFQSVFPSSDQLPQDMEQ